MDILMFETCWANISEIKTISDIKLVFNSSTITMMHSPVNIRWKGKVYIVVISVLCLSFRVWLEASCQFSEFISKRGKKQWQKEKKRRNGKHWKIEKRKVLWRERKHKNVKWNELLQNETQWTIIWWLQRLFWVSLLQIIYRPIERNEKLHNLYPFPNIFDCEAVA